MTPHSRMGPYILRKYGDLIIITACSLVILKYTFENQISSPITLQEMEGVNDLFDYDLELIKFTKKRVLLQPRSRSVPYKLDKDEVNDSENNIASTIHSLLGKKENGFFIECGAWDGEKDSNTLMLEKNFNWTGLLIEGSPAEAKKIIAKNRKAWIAPVCMSTTTSSMIVSYMEDSYAGRIIGPNGKDVPGISDVALIPQLCIPFNTFLLSLNQNTVDYLSLDVEGHELEILHTIDFKSFQINTLTIEHAHSKNKVRKIIKFMKENGFKAISKTEQDLIFVHKSLRK